MKSDPYIVRYRYHRCWGRSPVRAAWLALPKWIVVVAAFAAWLIFGEWFLHGNFGGL